jgi:hypothetical protein
VGFSARKSKHRRATHVSTDDALVAPLGHHTVAGSMAVTARLTVTTDVQQIDALVRRRCKAEANSTLLM